MAWRIQGQKHINKQVSKEYAPKYLNTKWRYQGQEFPFAIAKAVSKGDLKATVNPEDTLIALRNKFNALHKSIVEDTKNLKKAKEDHEKELLSLQIEAATKEKQEIEAAIKELEPKVEEIRKSQKQEMEEKAEVSGKPEFLS